jgi:hypothetical protein
MTGVVDFTGSVSRKPLETWASNNLYGYVLTNDVQLSGAEVCLIICVGVHVDVDVNKAADAVSRLSAKSRLRRLQHRQPIHSNSNRLLVILVKSKS